jgi:uncharacterized protein (DUF305 family)
MHLTRLAAVSGGLALALALAACGDGADEATSAGTTPSTEVSTGTAGATAHSAEALDADHNDADTMFAQMMIVHHEGAIEMADLALVKADADEVRTLAERISAAQGPEIEEMTSWLETWEEETSPGGDMEGMDHHGGMDMGGTDQEAAMAELESLSGVAFDRRFLELMIMHHEGAVEMARTELDDGKNPRALDLARTIILDQEMEIAEMEQMRDAL